MKKKEQINSQKFKDVLSHAYKLGTEQKNINSSILIEEIKKQLLMKSK